MALAQRGEPVVIPLWPNGAPNDNHLTGEEGHPDPRSVNNVSKPELWVYPAFRPNGTVIIACPGGGNKLNNRPRKRLGYLTPNEKFNSILTN